MARDANFYQSFNPLAHFLAVVIDLLYPKLIKKQFVSNP